MSFTVQESDCRILADLAEYRLLNAGQMAVLHDKNKQVLWRRLRAMEREHLIHTLESGLGRDRGRPEKVFTLTSAGVYLLKNKDVIRRDLKTDQMAGDDLHCVEHQLLLNWFRIHLKKVEMKRPRLKVEFLSHNSPMLPVDEDGCPVVSEMVKSNTAGQGVRFVPDGVFATIDSEGIACLFFLEVDCGTETLASPRRDGKDIRQKICNYQRYFSARKYKKYERIWQRPLNGFRLLFLTHSEGRLTALCQLVREMPPADFIWLTEPQRVFGQGAAAAIWARGGRIDREPQSILGSLAFSSPPLKP